mmetsp:Transcript_2106/g.4313  ORF Transcript_2106/g.4313 Transcript_2106/m.4313 type:complete len:218 (-) Transcript_2106:230-883(-)
MNLASAERAASAHDDANESGVGLAVWQSVFFGVSGRLSEYHLSSAASESFHTASLKSRLRTFDAFLTAVLFLVNYKGLPPAEFRVLIPALVRAAVKAHVEAQRQWEEQGGVEQAAKTLSVEMHADNPSRRQGVARGGALRPRPLQHSTVSDKSRYNRPAAAEPELQQNKVVRKVKPYKPRSKTATPEGALPQWGSQTKSAYRQIKKKAGGADWKCMC